MPAPPALLCYDGSPGARRAIGVAGGLLGGGPAFVLTVWQPLGLSLLAPVSGTIARASGIGGEFDEVAANAASECAAQGVELARASGFDPVAMALDGRPREVIIETAQRQSARVIVLGSRGLSGVESALLGSVATGVLHHSHGVPLLVVPPSAPGRSAAGC
jgi:nucleotide-binding universal stress UspA family protein